MRESAPLVKVLAGSTVLLALITALPKIFAEAVKGSADAPAAPAPPAQPVDMTRVAIVGVIVLALIVGGATIYVLRRRHTARAIEQRTEQSRLATQTELWQQGVETLTKTSEALMNFETDPESVYFTRPLLADVNEPATAAFYTAYDIALNLRTETTPADSDIIIKFVDAATAAQRAFGKADENARRKARLGISHGDQWLTPDERRKIGQAQKLMRQAHDPAVTEAAARNALTKALSLLDAAGVIVPERLTANVTKSIAGIHRRALTS
ncbi:MAG: hypothetical protein EKK51_21235 [Mycolicibacterium sp.]|uniref:hypothetical protein n=1 Tax=Mycobacteriaceae TaxID=1762 RepID=UPI000FBC46F9|nr:hypothetical protein [Mycolicibacterium sp.]RUP29208.1 MAG: hypothetical protein EKK51_21235 [Mycolicibacterium sp.]